MRAVFSLLKYDLLKLYNEMYIQKNYIGTKTCDDIDMKRKYYITKSIYGQLLNLTSSPYQKKTFSAHLAHQKMKIKVDAAK